MTQGNSKVSERSSGEDAVLMEQQWPEAWKQTNDLLGGKALLCDTQ